MDSINFQSESPSFKESLNLSLVRFLAYDFLDGPRQRRVFELTGHSLLKQAVSLSFGETTEEPDCSQVKKLKLKQIQTKF